MPLNIVQAQNPARFGMQIYQPAIVPPPTVGYAPPFVAAATRGAQAFAQPYRNMTTQAARQLVPPYEGAGPGQRLMHPVGQSGLRPGMVSLGGGLQAPAGEIGRSIPQFNGVRRLITYAGRSGPLGGLAIPGQPVRQMTRLVGNVAPRVGQFLQGLGL